MNFQILEHIDKLTPAKEKGRYICPECGGNNFTFSKDGAYSCWNGCERKDIRDKIAPLNLDRTARLSPARPVKRLQAKPKPAISIPSNESIQLAMLPSPANDSPLPQKQADKQHGEVWVTSYQYSTSQWVERIEWVDDSKPKGRNKTFKQWHRDDSGQDICKKGSSPWSAYRIDEVLAAVKGTKGTPALLHLEGEKCVEIARARGIASVTFQGSNWDNASLERHFTRLKNEQKGAIAVLLKDNDATGQKKSETFNEAAERAEVLAVVIDPVAIHPDLLDKGDIEEILAAMDTPEFIRRLEVEIHAALAARIQEQRLNDPDERLRLELQALQQESDLVKKTRRRAEIASHYGISKQEIQELLKHLDQKTTTPQKTWYSFDEFFNEGSEAIEWVVPQLLPRGETLLLAAQAKCGKTALATDIMYAVLSGSTVIGEQVGLKGKVLLISSDESPNSTRRRMRLRGFDLLDERSNLRLMTHLDITNLAELEAKLEDFRPDLVVIDSLTTICSEVGISEKDSEYAKYIYNLKAVLERYNAACILIHHENKDPLAKGINQVSGSARIPAAVWGILQLKAVNPNDDSDPQRWLKIKPREGEAITLKLQLNPKNVWLRDGIWTCTGELGDESGEKKTQGDRVIELLRQYSPKGLTHQEIDNALNIGRSLYQVLDRLEDRQLVTKRSSEFNSRQWVYAVPLSGGDTPPPSVDRTGSVKKTESIARSELQQFNNSFNNDSTPIQQPIVSDAVLNSQKQDVASDSPPIQQPDDREEGEGVLNSTDKVLKVDEGAIATPTPMTDSPTQQGEVSQIQATQIQQPPIPVTGGWYVGQQVMFWLGVGQRWAEGTIRQVQNDPARNFFKAVVETANGFKQHVWQESELMQISLQKL